jgi:hypothetical protein
MMEFRDQLHNGSGLDRICMVGVIVALGSLAGMGHLASSINDEFTKY